MEENLYAKYGVIPPEGYERALAERNYRANDPQWQAIEWLAGINHNVRTLQACFVVVIALLGLILWRVW